MIKGKVKYKGLLKKPIKIGMLSVSTKPSAKLNGSDKAISSEEMAKLLNNEYLEKCIEKISYLFDHYEIDDKTNFERLALCLAIDHVDGFQPKIVAMKLKHGSYGAVVPIEDVNFGRPKVWSVDKLTELYDDVQKIKRIEKIKKDRDALIILRNKPKWQSSESSDGGSKWFETLESRLHDAKRLMKQKKEIEIAAQNLIKLREITKDPVRQEGN